jgi:hypothetical protein
MMRKTLYLLLAVSVLALAPANVALAQKPEPPEGLEESIGPVPLDPNILPLDMQGASEAVESAVQLRESLSPKQIAAIDNMLAKFGPEMQAISEALAAASGVDIGKMAVGEAAAEPERLDADLAARMQALVADMDAEMAAILDADQFALHQAALVGPDEPLPGAAASSGGGVAPAEAEGYTSNCWYSPLYGVYAKYYAYIGYVYAYYAYAACGTTACYNAYYYAYYGYWFSRYQLDYSAPGYFGSYYTGMISVVDGYSYLYWAYYWGYYSYLYNYYSYVYATNCYSGCSGSSYAYYSYIYNYYSYYYAYYTYIYAYYCYYYW